MSASTREPPSSYSIEPQASQQLTIEAVPRTIRIDYVLEGELLSLGHSAGSPHAPLFGVVAGIEVSTLFVLLTVQLNDRRNALFFVTFLGSSVLAVYFGVQWRRDYKRQQHEIEGIRARPDAPPAAP